MALYRLDSPSELSSPTLVAAFDSWIDAGSASSTAAEHIAADGRVVAEFDGDRLFDYRARRPTLEIVDGRLVELTWPALVVRHRRIAGRDVLVMTGAEPDFRWQSFADAVVELAGRLDVALWISLGAIPAAVPHTRPINILGSTSRDGLLLGDIAAGPAGTLRVPSAAISVLEHAIAAAGVPAIGYYAQVPHYIGASAYAPATLALLQHVERRLGVTVPLRTLGDDAIAQRERLDAAIAEDDDSKEYLARLEALASEERMPSGDEIASEIERYLKEQT